MSDPTTPQYTFTTRFIAARYIELFKMPELERQELETRELGELSHYLMLLSCKVDRSTHPLDVALDITKGCEGATDAVRPLTVDEIQLGLNCLLEVQFPGRRATVPVRVVQVAAGAICVTYLKGTGGPGLWIPKSALHAGVSPVTPGGRHKFRLERWVVTKMAPADAAKFLSYSLERVA